MHAGVLHVLLQATLGGEKTLTDDAIVMRLTVVLFQATGVLQEPVATLAVIMRVETVCDELAAVFKVGLTFATVVMSGTLGVVLFESPPRRKVPITMITVVVIGRIQEVLAV